MALIEQQLDYPDNQYEGNLGVDDKEPELKWAVPGHSAVPELFNWLGRKTTEDIQAIRDYLDTLESVRKLTPLSELMPIANKEPNIMYVNGFNKAFGFRANEPNEVGGKVSLLRTEPKVYLRWSMPEPSTSTEPEISVDIDISGVGDDIGDEIISTTKVLTVPDQPNEMEETVFDLGDVSEGEEDSYGYDTVRGKDISIFISRSPDTEANGLWNLHSVEVH